MSLDVQASEKDKQKMRDPVIECHGLEFSYNGLAVLRGMDFKVRRGEVFALLGPNGAGKTTTIRVLNGLLPPRAGYVRVLGYDPVHAGALIRQKTGVLTETPALYERLTGWQNLQFFGTLAGLSAGEVERRGGAYLEMFNLRDGAQARVETYSKGMKQRLALARTLLHDPQLIFLDEPTSGMDPAAAKQVEALIYQVSKREQRSVVLCTHRLYEAEQVCDRVAIMKNGALITCGSLAELRQSISPGLRLQLDFAHIPPVEAIEAVRSQVGVLEVSCAHPLRWEVSVSEEKVIPALIRLLVERDAALCAAIPRAATLEEIYLLLQENDKPHEVPA